MAAHMPTAHELMSKRWRRLWLSPSRATLQHQPASAPWFSTYLHATLPGPALLHCAPMLTRVWSAASIGEPTGKAASKATCAESASANRSNRKCVVSWSSLKSPPPDCLDLHHDRLPDPPRGTGWNCRIGQKRCAGRPALGWKRGLHAAAAQRFHGGPIGAFADRVVG